MEDTSGTATDPFSDLTSLRIPQEQLQTVFAGKKHPPNPRTLPIRTKSIGGPILVDWLVAAAKQGKDALLVGLMVWCARNWPKLGRATESVVLSDEVFNAWGIARPARALSRLQSSGLIKIVSCHERHVEVDILLPVPFRGQFILGPIDVSWILRAVRLGVKVLLCGLALWYLHGRRRKWTYDRKVVSNLALDGWGISPDAKRRALLKLANAGLIEVEYRGTRSPRVMILSPYAKDKAKASARPCSGEVAA
jgi:DNA-binding transcriptional ArsR family regulator